MAAVMAVEEDKILIKMIFVQEVEEVGTGEGKVVGIMIVEEVGMEEGKVDILKVEDWVEVRVH
jgi:hypothetical protein